MSTLNWNIHKGSKMDNYTRQNSCGNCRYVFIRKEFDTADQYFCEYNTPKRPMCCSVFMGEYRDTLIIDATQEDWNAWNEWASKREVHLNGICDNYKGKVIY